jgi:hypothetical protein
MRDRSGGSSTRPRLTQRPAKPRPAGDHIGPEVVRQFASDDLDLDHLVEAIRCLLGEEGPTQADSPSEAASDLHLVRRRGTHVVGATRTS